MEKPRPSTKKKQKTPLLSPQKTNEDGVEEEEDSLVAAARGHDAYVRSVLAMLPAELVRAESDSDDSEDEETDALDDDDAAGARRRKKITMRKVPAYARKFYKNVAGRAPEQDRKEASKRGKRRKYDAVLSETDGDGDEHDETAPDPQKNRAAMIPPRLRPPAATSDASIDELRSRLRAKVEAARAARGGDKTKTKTDGSKKKRPEKTKQKNKSLSSSSSETAVEKKAPSSEEEKKKKQETTESPAPPLQDDVKVANLRPPKKREREAGRVGAPGSKTKRLKALAEEAAARDATLARLRREAPDEASKLEWREALQLASGDKKAPLDATKLTKALKAREKRKDKSRKTWDARLKKQRHAAQDDKGEKTNRKKKQHTESSSSSQPAAGAAAQDLEKNRTGGGRSPKTARDVKGAAKDEKKRPRGGGVSPGRRSARSP